MLNLCLLLQELFVSLLLGELLSLFLLLLFVVGQVDLAELFLLLAHSFDPLDARLLLQVLLKRHLFRLRVEDGSCRLLLTLHEGRRVRVVCLEVRLGHTASLLIRMLTLTTGRGRLDLCRCRCRRRVHDHYLFV